MHQSLKINAKKGISLLSKEDLETLAILHDDPYDQEKFLQTFAKLKKDLEEVEVLMRREFAQDIAILERSEQE